ncbi:MAG: helix-turn-helix domain-containing protein [Chitinophaga sp.]|uniref:AraC family transcriptional regulator n=1 Tax=Chitinophaga sp. TaxID=1869181 RepID=UPI001B164735|nr:AraC family transcriptional regulator [Chitinophaga sp.]MBO9730212.1 helix-turn-helix domain-containing protein [Chitinophaga sp.]
MKKLKQFDTLVIHAFEEAVFHLPVHSHTYYEIVYIFKGSGIHHLNNNQLPYKAGDLFLIAPEDEHYFDISKTTRFAFIKFTDSYFSTKSHLAPDAFLMGKPEAMMRHKLLKEVKLTLEEPCKTILRNTIESIVAYNCRQDVATSPLVYYQILSVFGLVKEAVSRLDIRIDHGAPDKEALISYIHQHIYEPEKIQVKNIAAHFNIAVNYFSAWFKRNFDISYREYVNCYRTKLIEKRITCGQLTLKQISAEFGFADESHLSHFFKSRHKMTPVSFRRKSEK